MDSLICQDYPHVEILIRDDASQDETVKTLENYVAENTNISLIKGEKNLGFIASYFKLLSVIENKFDYIAFCDQDDVWEIDKISVAVRFMDKFSDDTPLLYSSRLEIVDRNLNFLCYSNIPQKKLDFNNALVECPINGCTMMINKAAHQLFSIFPDYTYSHDWWIYLVVSAFGEVKYDSCSKILYRQHADNVYGLPKNIFFNLKLKLIRFFKQGKNQPIMQQAKEFKKLYGSLLSDDKYNHLTKLLNYDDSIVYLIMNILNLSVYRQSNFDNLTLKFLLLVKRL